MKSWLQVAVLAMGLAGLAPVYAAVTPDEVVKTTSEQVIARVKSDKAALQADTKKLYALVDELLIPHFDFEGAARLVLAQNWRVATDEQKKRFVEAYKKLMVHTYANALLEFSDQQISYKPAQQDDADKVTVPTQIDRPGEESVPVYYRMHKRDGEWKVYDVVVGGISLVVTRRGEFADMVRQHGIDGLISQLESHNDDMAVKGAQQAAKP